MHRTVLSSNNGEHQVRHEVRLEGTVGLSPTGEFGDLILLMRIIVDQPDLLRHAVNCPAEVTFRYHGANWVCTSVCYENKEGNLPR